MTDKLEQWLQRYLESRPGSFRAAGGEDYPSALELYRYLNDELQGTSLERMLDFLKGNPEGQRLVLRARELMQDNSGWEKENVPTALLGQAKSLTGASGRSLVCPHCGKRVTPFKKPLKEQTAVAACFGALALGSLGLSFIFHHIYMQFLAVSVLAGIKAIVEMRVAKTQILIYKALSDGSGDREHRLHEHSSRL